MFPISIPLRWWLQLFIIKNDIIAGIGWNVTAILFFMQSSDRDMELVILA